MEIIIFIIIVSVIVIGVARASAKKEREKVNLARELKAVEVNWEKAEKEREKEIARFRSWLVKAGIQLECTRCLSNEFYIIQYPAHGLSFQAICNICGSKKWFKTKNEVDPFPFSPEIFKSLIDAPSHIREVAPDMPEEDRHISTRVRREVWRRDQGRCIKCGSQRKLEYDHMIPYSKGGSNTARNIQLLCENCNRKKHAIIQ